MACRSVLRSEAACEHLKETFTHYQWLINMSSLETTDGNDGGGVVGVTQVDETDSGSATCNECRKDPGICCFDKCQADGSCPMIDIENGHWTKGGQKITGSKK